MLNAIAFIYRIVYTHPAYIHLCGMRLTVFPFYKDIYGIYETRRAFRALVCIMRTNSDTNNKRTTRNDNAQQNRRRDTTAEVVDVRM